MPVVFVDIDDTLVRSAGGKRIPMTAMVERVRALHAAGAELYAWSRGGAAYAAEVARDLGLGDCFRACVPKPDLLIDDAALESWKLPELHPNTCLGMSAAEILERARR